MKTISGGDGDDTLRLVSTALADRAALNPALGLVTTATTTPGVI